MERAESPDRKRARKSAISERSSGSSSGGPSLKASQEAAAERKPSASCVSSPKEKDTPLSLSATTPASVGDNNYSDDSDDDSLMGDLKPHELVSVEMRKHFWGEPPQVSGNAALEEVRQEAVRAPKTLRNFIQRKAEELAIDAKCSHVDPLVTWDDDRKAAETCGRLQAFLISRVDMKEVLQRQKKHHGKLGYCLARRVRNQVYYDSAQDLGCEGWQNQCRAGTCMRAALKVFAGDNEEGLPTEIVRALCTY